MSRASKAFAALSRGAANMYKDKIFREEKAAEKDKAVMDRYAAILSSIDKEMSSILQNPFAGIDTKRMDTLKIMKDELVDALQSGNPIPSDKLRILENYTDTSSKKKEEKGDGDSESSISSWIGANFSTQQLDEFQKRAPGFMKFLLTGYLDSLIPRWLNSQIDKQVNYENLDKFIDHVKEHGWTQVFAEHAIPEPQKINQAAALPDQSPAYSDPEVYYQVHGQAANITQDPSNKTGLINMNTRPR